MLLEEWSFPLRLSTLLHPRSRSWTQKLGLRASRLQTQHIWPSIPFWNMVVLGTYFSYLKLWSLSSNWGIKRKSFILLSNDEAFDIIEILYAEKDCSFSSSNKKKFIEEVIFKLLCRQKVYHMQKYEDLNKTCPVENVMQWKCRMCAGQWWEMNPKARMWRSHVSC